MHTRGSCACSGRGGASDRARSSQGRSRHMRHAGERGTDDTEQGGAMPKLNLGRGIAAGAVGTAAITMIMLGAPLMGMPAMPIGDMLGSFLHIGSVAGWAMHVVIGLALALVYAGWFAARLPGGPALRGGIYGFGVFLVAQVVVTPMMGGGLFSGGNISIVAGSMLGHLVYGVMVGLIYREPAGVRELAHA